MHWLEGVLMAATGFIPWMIASGRFPSDPQQRAELERKMAIVRNKGVMRAAAVVLWVIGGAAILGFVR